MTQLYSIEEWEKGRALKRKMRNILISVLVASGLVNVLIFVIRCITVEWGESDFWYLFANCVLIVLTGFFLLLYCGIPYRLCKNYMKVLDTVVRADPQRVEAIFLGMEPEEIDKEGVKFYNLLFHEGRDRKGRDIIERIMLDASREMPDFEIGDRVLYEAPSKILKAYEVTEKGALDEADVDNMMNMLNERIGLEAEVEMDSEPKPKYEIVEKTKE